MKTTRSYLTHSGRLLATIVGLAPMLATAQIKTNWVAYNDHRRGPTIPPHVPTAASWGTLARVTDYDMGAPGNTTAAVLTNFYTGDPLPVTMSVIRTGSPDEFVTVTAPQTDTPAGGLFFGVLDLSNPGIVGVDAGLEGGGTVDSVKFTFNGLNPDKRYLFRGTSGRGGGYGFRWSVATITNVNGFIDAHINGVGVDPNSRVLTSNDFPADLGPGQAAWNSGDNVEGAVVGWDFIAPMPDGSFSILVEQYTNHISATALANDVNYGYSFGAILLAEVEVVPPAITQQPAAQTDVEASRPFSLSVGASGTPLFYQWYKQGSGAISGATSPTYRVSQAAFPGDSGNYHVVVYNLFARQTSSVAHVTVSADATPPGIATAFSYPHLDSATQTASLDQVIIEFSEPIQAAGATDPTHYVISAGIGNPASVVLTNERTVALQLSTSLAEDSAYTVQVSGVIDLVGNNINNGGTNNPAAFRSWMRGAGNGLFFEVFDGIAGSNVVNLMSDPLYPNRATFRTNLWIFDSRAALPNDARENYGSRTRGVFIPPVSGDWVFYLRGIDICRLYLNRNGPDAAGKQLIADEAAADTDGNWGRIVSNPLSLRAGRGYYIEALLKSDTGADFVKVAARLAGTGIPPNVPNTQLDTNALMGAALASPLAPRDLGGTLTITQEPASANVEEGHDATFSVQVTNPSGLPVQYQWFRDGNTEIPGANGPIHTFMATSADSHHTLNVRVAKVGTVVTSQSATLTVRPDATPPQAFEAIGHYTNLFGIIVRFDERVMPLEATNLFDYYLVGVGRPSRAILLPDGKTSIIQFVSPLPLGQIYQLNVLDVRDLAGNQISPNPTTLTFTAGQGGLPRLSVVYGNSYVYVAWPAPSTGFRLEASSSLRAPNWTTFTQTPVVIGGQNTVMITPGGEARFYRLKQ